MPEAGCGPTGTGRSARCRLASASRGTEGSVATELTTVGLVRGLGR